MGKFDGLVDLNKAETVPANDVALRGVDELLSDIRDFDKETPYAANKAILTEALEYLEEDEVEVVIDALSTATGKKISTLRNITKKLVSSNKKEVKKIEVAVEAGVARFADLNNCITQANMANHLASKYGETIGYVSDFEKWLIVNNETNLWEPDTFKQLPRLIITVLSQIREQAFELIRSDVETDNAKGNALLREISKAQNAYFVSGTLSLLQSHVGITKLQSEFDSDPCLVGFRDGMCCNLNLGTVRAIKASDKLTQTLGVAYDADATCELWKKCLLEWCQQNEELVRFLQVYVGYLLSGLTNFHGFIFLFGDGRNGKSTFLRIINALLGMYARAMSSDSLKLTKLSGINNDIARLQGSRLITVSEISEGMRLDEKLVKSLTGGDVLTARFLHKEFGEFINTGKILMVGNDKPIITGTDSGIWSRMNAVPFTADIKEKNIGLVDELTEELAGVLNWALKGFEIYKKEGLLIPDVVKRESQAYREASDIIGQFLEDCCVIDPTQQIHAKVLYEKYTNWCTDGGIKPMSSIALNKKLGKRPGVYVDKDNRDSKGRIIEGVVLKPVDK